MWNPNKVKSSKIKITKTKNPVHENRLAIPWGGGREMECAKLVKGVKRYEFPV